MSEQNNKPVETPKIVTDAIYGADYAEVCGFRLYRPTLGHNTAYDKLRRKIVEEDRSGAMDLALAVQVYSTPPNSLRDFVQNWTFESLEDMSGKIRVEDTANILGCIETLLKNIKKLQQISQGEEGGGNPTRATVD